MTIKDLYGDKITLNQYEQEEINSYCIFAYADYIYKACLMAAPWSYIRIENYATYFYHVLINDGLLQQFIEIVTDERWSMEEWHRDMLVMYIKYCQVINKYNFNKKCPDFANYVYSNISGYTVGYY